MTIRILIIDDDPSIRSVKALWHEQISHCVEDARGFSGEGHACGLGKGQATFLSGRLGSIVISMLSEAEVRQDGKRLRESDIALNIEFLKEAFSLLAPSIVVLDIDFHRWTSAATKEYQGVLLAIAIRRFYKGPIVFHSAFRQPALPKIGDSFGGAVVVEASFSSEGIHLSYTDGEGGEKSEVISFIRKSVDKEAVCKVLGLVAQENLSTADT